MFEQPKLEPDLERREEAKRKLGYFRQEDGRCNRPSVRYVLARVPESSRTEAYGLKEAIDSIGESLLDEDFHKRRRALHDLGALYRYSKASITRFLLRGIYSMEQEARLRREAGSELGYSCLRVAIHEQWLKLNRKRIWGEKAREVGF